MAREKTYLTYEECQRLLSAKSKRKHRTLTQCSRLYRHENGCSYVVKATSWRGEPHTGEKVVYEPPLAIIHPHNVAILDDTASRPGLITVHNLFYKFFGVRGKSRSDKRSSVRFWWYNARKVHVGTPVPWYPFTNGMQIDLLSGEPVAGVEVEKRRKVDLEKAKPIRDQVAAWDKFARTYFQLLDVWDERHVALAKVAKATAAAFPRIDEEPTVEGLLQVLYAGNRWNVWRLTSGHYDGAAKQARRSWNIAFERWKEHLYAEHGAFTWELVAQAA